MPYAVTLCLDPASAAQIRLLWEALAREHLSSTAVNLGYDPHITLTIHDDSTDATALIGAAHDVSAEWDVLPVTCPALALFPGRPATLWIAPAVTETLLHRQAALCAGLPDATLHAHYRPGTWIPHITLADDLGPEAVGAALATAAATFQPLAGALDRIEVVRFRPITRLWHAGLRAPRRLL